MIVYPYSALAIPHLKVTSENPLACTLGADMLGATPLHKCELFLETRGKLSHNDRPRQAEDVEWFLDKAAIVEKILGRKADKLVLVAVNIDKEAFERAQSLGIAGAIIE